MQLNVSKAKVGLSEIPLHQNSLFLFYIDATDTLDDRTKQFFKKCVQSSVKKEWKDDQFKKIKEVS